MSNLSFLVSEILAEFPDFKLVYKDQSRFMKFLAVLVWPFCSTFQEYFATTIGHTVYYPRAWSDGVLYEVLRHERVHLRDSKKWGLLYYLTYTFLPLPFLVSGRAYWEFRGYCETLKVLWERGGRQVSESGAPIIREPDLRWVVGQFTGPSYLFMFPFEVTLRRAFRRASLDWVR